MNKTKKITQLGMLLTICIVLSFLENNIVLSMAMPVGVKLGLSNIIIMFAFSYFGVKEAYFLMVTKSLFVFITKGVTSFFMSICGGFFSITVMIILFKIFKIKNNFVLIAMAGAVAHNIGQIIMASIILKTTSTIYYLPILLISGLVLGFTTGVTFKVIIARLKKLNI